MAIPTWLRGVRYLGITLLATVLAFGLAQTTEDLTNPSPEDWPTSGRTLDGQRFSPLDQINTGNVEDLRLSWIRALEFDGSVGFTPVVVDGVMYINGNGVAIALDATDGTTLWRYEPEVDEATPGFFTTRQRGSVVVYEGSVYYSRPDGLLAALDAATGEERWTSTIGNIGLSEGFTTGPIFADGKLIVGPSGADFGGNPGKIHAVDSTNGELLWTFDIIPGPEDAEAFASWDPPPSGEPGYGGGSAWVPGIYDPETRTVIYGTGQPTPWDRHLLRQGDKDLYTASFVALDVDTGELKWYHQVVPADEWDSDQIVTPVIADIEIGGAEEHVAILTSVSGWIIVVDAETGAFFDAYQMFPEPSVVIGYTDDGEPIINEENRFTSPEDTGTVCPFRYASFEFGAYSPDTGLYYRPNDYTCWENTVVTPLPDDWQPGDAAFNFTTDNNVDMFDRLGAISAIDPSTGEVVWEFSHPYSQRAGAMATAGGLVFAGFPDRTFRAFDAASGDLLWQQSVSSGTNANPITYAVDGKQYIAIPIGSGGGTGQEGAPPLVGGPATMFVFALP
jgi:quinohemoprotein ethanol dehydrogenase